METIYWSMDSTKTYTEPPIIERIGLDDDEWTIQN